MNTLDINTGGKNIQNTLSPVNPPVTRMDYHGTAGEIFRLHLMNLLMNIITLGIYSFWGKTRIRRYMTSHIAIRKDRFEYTGTGKELLIGWIKAMVIFLPIAACMSIPVVNFIAIPIFFGIFSIAIYLALRYRLSRTKWRGIRFNLGGSIKEYFFISLKRTLKNIVTLGWRIPKSDIIRWSYIANHMSYGDLKFSYEGDYSRLQKIHVTTLLIFTLPLVLGLLIGGILKGQELVNNAKARESQNQKIEQVYSEGAVNEVSPQAGEDTSNSEDVRYTKSDEESPSGAVAVSIICLFFVMGVGFIGRLWYHAALWQEKFRGLRLANLRFKGDISGRGLAKLYIINILIVIFTLTLGKPIAMQRTFRYFITNLRIGGDLNELIAQQNKENEKSGMGDALATDVGFDLGM